MERGYEKVVMNRDSGMQQVVHDELSKEEDSVIRSSDGSTTTVATPEAGMPESLLSPFLSGVILSLFILSSALSVLVVRYSKKRAAVDPRYIYDNATMVMLTEVVKLCASIVLQYAQDGEIIPASVLVGSERRALWRSGVYFVVPAVVYAASNNLAYLILAHVDPATYKVFLQSRILFSGLFSWLLLRRGLTLRKWLALFILVAGMIIKFWSPRMTSFGELRYIWSILLQASCSSFGSVFNELAFKRDVGLSIHKQNFFVYFYSILCNILVSVVVNGGSFDELMQGVSWVVTPIIFLGVTMGLSTSLLLKYINSVVKAMASAVEVLVVSILAYFFLDEPLTSRDMIACIVVSAGIYIYSTTGMLWIRRKSNLTSMGKREDVSSEETKKGS